MNEELVDVAVPALVDTEELLLAAGRVFSRDEAQPCGQIASLLELASAANSCQKCRGTQCANSWNRHEPTGSIVSICDRSDLPRHIPDSLLQPAQCCRICSIRILQSHPCWYRATMDGAGEGVMIELAGLPATRAAPFEKLPA